MAARAAEHALAAMRGEASASWWIDSRGETPRSMLGRVAARSKDPSAAKVAELAGAFRCRLRTSRFFVTSSYSFVARESDGGRVYIKAVRYLRSGTVSKTIKCGYVRNGEYTVPEGEYNIVEDWFE